MQQVTRAGEGSRAVVVAALATLGALATGCHRDAEPGSCTREREGACVEFDRAHATAGKQVCAGHRWTPGEGSCPKDNRVGTCLREGGKTAEYMYSGPPNAFTPAAAKAACQEAGGTFRP